jgi:hypothetical protein
MNYLLIFLIFFILLIVLYFFLNNRREDFSQDIKTRGKKLIDSSRQSLNGYYDSIKNITTITDKKLKNTIESFSKFQDPKILEDNIKKIEKVLNCEDGNFMNPNFDITSTCSICKASFYCINARSYQCPLNTWSNSGATGCSDLDKCPVGFMCTNKIQENCPTGSFCTSGVSNICPSGSYCTNGNRTKCPTGTFNELTGKFLLSDCLRCSAGYYCIDGLRKECPINTWSDELETSSSCKPMSDCPEGNACGTKKKVQCATGTWSNTGQSSCSQISICPAGSSCGNLVRRTCATGTWSNTGQISCSPISICPAGSSCGTGQRVLCATGTYSDSGATVCLANSKCPSGYYISYNNSTGTYTGGIKVLCEEGFRCSNGVKTACPIGQFSSAGSSSCMLCPPGSACKNGIRTLCGTGTFSDSPGSTECKYCPIMSKTTGANGDVITRNFNVKTLNSAGTEVFQGASQCKLAEHNQSCSNTEQCGLNDKGNKLCCAYWKGSPISSYPSGNYCADPDSWTDWALTTLGKYDKCMTGPVSQFNYPYVKPGEYNYSYDTIGPGP